MSEWILGVVLKLYLSTLPNQPRRQSFHLGSSVSKSVRFIRSGSIMKNGRHGFTGMELQTKPFGTYVGIFSNLIKSSSQKT